MRMKELVSHPARARTNQRMTTSNDNVVQTLFDGPYFV